VEPELAKPEGEEQRPGGAAQPAAKFRNPGFFLFGTFVCLAFAVSIGRFPLWAMMSSPNRAEAIPLLFVSGVLPGLGFALIGSVVCLARWRELTVGGRIKTVILAVLASAGFFVLLSVMGFVCPNL